MVKEQEKLFSELRSELGLVAVMNSTNLKLLRFAEERNVQCDSLTQEYCDAQYTANVVDVVLALCEKYSIPKVREALRCKEFKRYFSNYFATQK